jgi:hypothetical protein
VDEDLDTEAYAAPGRSRTFRFFGTSFSPFGCPHVSLGDVMRTRTLQQTPGCLIRFSLLDVSTHLCGQAYSLAFGRQLYT